MTNPFYFCFSFILCFVITYPFFVFLCLLGNIKNTEPLDSKRQRVHTFWVTAFDCGKNRAQADAQVVVTVKPSCKPGWIGNQCHRSLFSLSWLSSPARPQRCVLVVYLVTLSWNVRGPPLRWITFACWYQEQSFKEVVLTLSNIKGRQLMKLWQYIYRITRTTTTLSLTFLYRMSSRSL